MKRKRVSWAQEIAEQHSESHEHNKKIKLTENDMKFFKILLENENSRLMKYEFQLLLKEKKLSEMLLHFEYEPFMHAIKNRNFSYFQQLISSIPPKHQFLAVSYKDYTIIKKFIDAFLEDLSNSSYKPEIAIDIFKTLISIKPIPIEDQIRSLIKEIIEDNNQTSVRYIAAHVLLSDFETALEQIQETYMQNNVTDKSNMISPSRG